MKINQLASNDESGALNALEHFPIWNANVESLTKYQLLACYALMKRRLGVRTAIDVVRTMKGEALLAFMLGDIADCPIIYWRPPVEDLIAPHLLSFMRSIPFNARACILVAMAEEAPIESMMRLQWSEVKLNTWSDFSKRILNRVPPRLGCPAVFWEENTLSRPVAISNLPGLIHHELDVSWSEFANVCAGLIQFEHFAHPEIEQLLFAEISS